MAYGNVQRKWLITLSEALVKGKKVYRKILCLHTLSTICPIDFELRHTFRPPACVPPAAKLALDPRSLSLLRAALSLRSAPLSRELKSFEPAQFLWVRA